MIARWRTYMNNVFLIINRTYTEEDENKKDTHELGFYFYDLNVKLVHRFSSRVDLEAAWFRNDYQLKGETKAVTKNLSSYNRDDYQNRQNVGWRNQTFTLRANEHGEI